jgi:Lrp/AsnC family leucine-responsive transcriptional regulator
MLVVVSEDLDAYGVFVDTVLKMLPGVTGIHSTLSLKEVKASSRVPVR